MPHGPEDDADGSGRRAGHARQAPDGGAAGAFEDALLVLVPGLRRYSHSLTRTDADGEDLLQDCVETALQRRAQWRGVNLRAWTFTIMTNLYRNRHRARVRWPTTAIDEAQEIADADRSGDPLERARVRTALDALHPDIRTTLMLVVVEGYTYQEAAGIMQIPIGTVMSRLSRARHQLAELLAKDNIVPLRRPK